jgi:tetratricopeptide (TPR) repeat protein
VYCLPGRGTAISVPVSNSSMGDSHGKGFMVRILTLITCAFVPSVHCQTLEAPSQLRSGIVAYEKGAIKEAIADLEQVVSLDPQSTVGHFYLASAYEMMCLGSECDSHWSELAVQQYARVLELDPSHKEAMKRMASVIYRQQRIERIDEAEGLYRRAAKLDANDAEALYAIAVFDWIRVYRALWEERLQFRRGQKQALIGLPTCSVVRTKTMPDIDEGIALLTRALQFVSYAEPQLYMAWFFMERAEIQCGDRYAYKRDLKSEQHWLNQACVAWHNWRASPYPWLPSPPPPLRRRGDTCSWSSRD